MAQIADPFKGMDPMSSATPSPLDAGMGDEALEAHMEAFLRATKAGNAKDMATAFRAASEACYSAGEPEGTEPPEAPL